MRNASRASRVATVAVAGAAALAVVPPALAAARAIAPAKVATSSGSWGAAAGAVGVAPTIGSAYAIRWTSPAVPQYLTVTNTGALQLLSTTYSGTNSKATNGSVPPEVGFDACVGGTWAASSDTCSGTVVRIGATAGGTFTVTSTTTAAAPGGRLSVRAFPTSLPNFPHEYTTSLSLTVTRSQARAAATTHQ